MYSKIRCYSNINWRWVRLTLGMVVTCMDGDMLSIRQNNVDHPIDETIIALKFYSLQWCNSIHATLHQWSSSLNFDLFHVWIGCSGNTMKRCIFNYLWDGK